MKRIQNSLLVVLSILLFFACSKEKINNADNGFPLELSLDQDGSRISLDWTKTELSSFLQYVIVRSVTPIEGSLEDNLNLVIERIDDFGENTFLDESAPFADELYYQIFVDIGGRVLSSQVEKVEFDLIVIPNEQVNLVTIDASRNALFFSSVYGGSSIFRFDYESESLTHDFNGNFFVQNIKFDKYGTNNELYLTNNGSTISVVNANNLTNLVTIFSSGTNYDVAISDNNIFCATDNFSFPLQVYSRSSGQEVASFALGEPFSTSRIEKIGASGNVIVDADFNNILLYQFSDEAELLASKTDQFGFLDLLPRIVSSKDGQYFIAHRAGHFYDQSLNQIGRVPGADINFISDYAFSEDGTKVFTIEFDNFINIRTYSFPELQLLDNRRINYTARRLFVDGNELIVVGDGFINFNSSIVIEKISI